MVLQVRDRTENKDEDDDDALQLVASLRFRQRGDSTCKLRDLSVHLFYRIADLKGQAFDQPVMFSQVYFPKEADDNGSPEEDPRGQRDELDSSCGTPSVDEQEGVAKLGEQSQQTTNGMSRSSLSRTPIQDEPPPHAPYFSATKHAPTPPKPPPPSIDRGFVQEALVYNLPPVETASISASRSWMSRYQPVQRDSPLTMYPETPSDFGR